VSRPSVNDPCAGFLLSGGRRLTGTCGRLAGFRGARLGGSPRRLAAAAGDAQWPSLRLPQHGVSTLRDAAGGNRFRS